MQGLLSTLPLYRCTLLVTEADLGMFIIFGRTAAPRAAECRTAAQHFLACVDIF